MESPVKPKVAPSVKASELLKGSVYKSALSPAPRFTRLTPAQKSGGLTQLVAELNAPKLGSPVLITPVHPQPDPAVKLIHSGKMNRAGFYLAGWKDLGDQVYTLLTIRPKAIRPILITVYVDALPDIVAYSESVSPGQGIQNVLNIGDDLAGPDSPYATHPCAASETGLILNHALTPRTLSKPIQVKLKARGLFCISAIEITPVL